MTTLKKINIWKVSTLVLAITLVLTICLLMSTKNAQNIANTPELNDNDDHNETIDVPSRIGSVLPKPSHDNSNNQAASNEPQYQSMSYSESIKVYGKDYPNELTGIDWGTIFLGTEKNYSISVLNIADNPIVLKLEVTNWTPGVNANITWNYDGKAVPANTMIPITLTLLIINSNVTSFGNSIIITASNA